jgi:LysR family transcriptional regulator (chromosome initiation inhibitor)
VLPELRVRELIESGELVNLAPRHRLGVALYWHCWNLSSDVLDALSKALRAAAADNLRPAS